MPVKHYKRQINKNPKKDGPRARWSDKQKYEAVAMYKMVGSLRAVGNTLGIPEETMRNWHQSDWWKTIEDEITTESRVKRSKRLDKLIDLATELVEDRLQNGEYNYNVKTGVLYRRPMNAVSANRILQTAVDKQILLENLAKDDKRAETAEKVQDRLAFLLEEMHRFAKSKDITHKSQRLEGGDPESTVLELEVLDAIHDEREEGLQEGASLGEESDGQGSSERPSSEELSPSGNGESRQGS